MKYRRFCKQSGCLRGPHARSEYCLAHQIERPATEAERARAQRWVDRRMLAALARTEWPR